MKDVTDVGYAVCMNESLYGADSWLCFRRVPYAADVNMNKTWYVGGPWRVCMKLIMVQYRDEW